MKAKKKNEGSNKHSSSPQAFLVLSILLAFNVLLLNDLESVRLTCMAMDAFFDHSEGAFAENLFGDLVMSFEIWRMVCVVVRPLVRLFVGLSKR
jgi:hypothetical protein